MSGLSRTPGKRVYGESRTVGSNPTLSASENLSNLPAMPYQRVVERKWATAPVRAQCPARAQFGMRQF